jgi:hypothetical protein
MLNSFTRTFDYAEFEKKLKHYFSDSAPINADVVLGHKDVQVSCQSGVRVSCDIAGNLDAGENVRRVVNTCTVALYPKMLVAGTENLTFSEEQKKSLLLQGFSVEQIREKEQKRTWLRYTLVRFNEHGSTIDYIEELTGIRYRAHLYQPLIMIKDKIWKLAFSGRAGMEELYRFLISVSKQEVLDNQKEDSEECGIHES